MNVTVPADLLECNLRLLGSMCSGSVIGENVRLARGTRVENSVIGDGVRIDKPIRISDSLILPGTKIGGSADIERSVISSRAMAAKRRGRQWRKDAAR